MNKSTPASKKFQADDIAALEAERAAKAKARESSSEFKAEFLEEFIRAKKNQLGELYDSIRTVARWVDDRGQMRVSQTPGLCGGWPPNAIVRTNHRGHTPAKEVLNRVISEASEMLCQLKYQKSPQGVPDDIRAYVKQLESSIPPVNNVFEVISGQEPKASNKTATDRK